MRRWVLWWGLGVMVGGCEDSIDTGGGGAPPGRATDAARRLVDAVVDAEPDAVLGGGGGGRLPLIDAAVDAAPDAAPEAGLPPECASFEVTVCRVDPDCPPGTRACVDGRWGPCTLGGERCNGEDDDCDGAIDEDFPTLGVPCTLGQGACRAAGTWVCDARGELGCDATPGVPGIETCGAFDEDCDGRSDEGLQLGAPCTAGQGPCARPGTRVCADDLTVVCDAVAAAAGVEVCNGLDDDCDGRADEDWPVGGGCTAGRGACARAGTWQCAGDARVACDAAAGPPGVETCNGVDDDCDGAVDEDWPGLGAACEAGVGGCLRGGRVVCTGPATIACDARAAGPTPERCGGVDEDCDGRVDEGFEALGQRCLTGGAAGGEGALVCGPDGALVCVE